MVTYDIWKTATPCDEKEKECGFCGMPTDSAYCSNECVKADIFDN